MSHVSAALCDIQCICQHPILALRTTYSLHVLNICLQLEILHRSCLWLKTEIDSRVDISSAHSTQVAYLGICKRDVRANREVPLNFHHLARV